MRANCCNSVVSKNFSPVSMNRHSRHNSRASNLTAKAPSVIVSASCCSTSSADVRHDVFPELTFLQLDIA